jgi:hypothetical protein
MYILVRMFDNANRLMTTNPAYDYVYLRTCHPNEKYILPPAPTCLYNVHTHVQCTEYLTPDGS